MNVCCLLQWPLRSSSRIISTTTSSFTRATVALSPQPSALASVHDPQLPWPDRPDPAQGIVGDQRVDRVGVARLQADLGEFGSCDQADRAVATFLLDAVERGVGEL